MVHRISSDRLSQNDINVEKDMLLGLQCWTLFAFLTTHTQSSFHPNEHEDQNLSIQLHNMMVLQPFILCSTISLSQWLNSQNSRQSVRLLENWLACSTLPVILQSEALYFLNFKKSMQVKEITFQKNCFIAHSLPQYIFHNSDKIYPLLCPQHPR